jgi:hypothetical protein
MSFLRQLLGRKEAKSSQVHSTSSRSDDASILQSSQHIRQQRGDLSALNKAAKKMGNEQKELLRQAQAMKSQQNRMLRQAKEQVSAIPKNMRYRLDRKLILWQHVHAKAMQEEVVKMLSDLNEGLMAYIAENNKEAMKSRDRR